MADPGLTAAQFDMIWARMMEAWLKPRRLLRKIHERFNEDKLLVYVDGDEDGYLLDPKAVLAGDLDTATHVDASHIAYVTIDADDGGTTTTTIDVYRDSARTDLQATGSIADGSVPGDVTVAGVATTDPDYTIRLASIPAADATDIRLFHAESFPKLARRVFNGDESQDSWLKETYLQACSQLAGQVRSQIATLDAWARAQLARYVAERIKAPEDESLTVKRVAGGGSTAVTYDMSGLLERLREAMADNTASVESVAVLTPSAGTVTYDANNTGTLTTATAPTVNPFAQAGRLTFRCTATGAGVTNFEGKFKPDNPLSSSGRRDVVKPLRQLRVNKSWSDPVTGVISMKIDYGMIPVDVTNSPFHATANLSVSGENETNMPSGLAYGRVDGSTGAWTVSFYSTAAGRNAETTDLLVAQATGVGNNSNFTAAAQNDSGLTITGQIDGTPADDDAANMDLRLAAVGDEFYSTFTVASGGGKIQSELAQLAPADAWYLRELATPTVAEGLLTRGGEPYDSRDY